MGRVSVKFLGVVRYYFIIIIILLLPNVALADTSRETQNILNRVEQYWNSIRTLEGRFQQVIDGKQGLSGDIFIEKPGKLRLKYHPPSELLIVAEGRTMAVYDGALDQLSYLDQRRLPMNFLLMENLAFAGQSWTAEAVDRPNYYEVAIKNSEWSIQGPLTLVFSKSPMQLQYWTFIDAAGKNVQVLLFPTQINEPIDRKNFVFRNPRYVR
jgi:outer membrane lipoprotein-sorting protein